MNSVAELRRRMTKGTVVTVDNLRYPALSGQRTVVTVQTNGWYLSFPQNHFRADYKRGSWLALPKRALIDFDGDSAVFFDDEADPPVPWLSLTVTP